MEGNYNSQTFRPSKQIQFIWFIQTFDYYKVWLASQSLAQQCGSKICICCLSHKASSMEDNYKFSKASHYLDQDSVKQNQFMVPNKSFNSKASPTKASSVEDNNKFSKASHYLDQDSVKQNQFMVPNKSFTNKSFNSKASPTKL
ncbi:hypothetical protein ACFX2G_034526 [Malus domestica]